MNIAQRVLLLLQENGVAAREAMEQETPVPPVLTVQLLDEKTSARADGKTYLTEGSVQLNAFSILRGEARELSALAQQALENAGLEKIGSSERYDGETRLYDVCTRYRTYLQGDKAYKRD